MVTMQEWKTLLCPAHFIFSTCGSLVQKEIVLTGSFCKWLTYAQAIVG